MQSKKSQMSSKDKEADSEGIMQAVYDIEKAFPSARELEVLGTVARAGLDTDRVRKFADIMHRIEGVVRKVSAKGGREVNLVRGYSAGAPAPQFGLLNGECVSDEGILYDLEMDAREVRPGRKGDMSQQMLHQYALKHLLTGLLKAKGYGVSFSEDKSMIHLYWA